MGTRTDKTIEEWFMELRPFVSNDDSVLEEFREFIARCIEIWREEILEDMLKIMESMADEESAQTIFNDWAKRNKYPTIEFGTLIIKNIKKYSESKIADELYEEFQFRFIEQFENFEYQNQPMLAFLN